MSGVIREMPVVLVWTAFVVGAAQALVDGGGVCGYADASDVMSGLQLAKRPGRTSSSAGRTPGTDHESVRSVGASNVRKIVSTFSERMKQVPSEASVYRRQAIVELAQMPNVRRICGVALSTGSSAAFWSKANPAAEVFMFHLDEHQENARAAEEDGRVKVFKGSSLKTVPELAKENPEIKCDLLAVEGVHSMGDMDDISNMINLANPDFHVLVVDETEAAEATCQSGSCIGTVLAKHEKRGLVKALHFLPGTPEVSHSRKDIGPWWSGVSILQFQFPEYPVVLKSRPSALQEALWSLKAVNLGSWKGLDLAPYTSLATALVPPETEWIEGSSTSFDLEREVYIKLAQMPNVKRICEIGFNAGGSASLWLKANPSAEVLMFDLWSHHYAPVAEASLRNASKMAEHGVQDADRRLRIVKGSSLQTVPAFAREHPETKCDLLSVDGGHTFKVAQADIINMFSLANPDFNVLVVDDTTSAPQPEVDAAVADCQERGFIRKVHAFSDIWSNHSWQRGVTILQYVFPEQ